MVDNHASFPLEERAVLLTVPRVGIEPTLPREGPPGYSRRGGPPHVRRRSSDTGGIRTHMTQGLRLLAIPVRAPCQHSSLPTPQSPLSGQSPRWESNPRFRHTKTAGSRYNTGAIEQHPRASGGSRTHASALRGRYAPTTSQRRCVRIHPPSFQQERLAGVEPAPPTWHAGVLPLTPQAPNTTRASGGARTRVTVVGGRYVSATPRMHNSQWDQEDSNLHPRD